MICLYLEYPEKFMCLIFPDRFWDDHIIICVSLPNFIPTWSHQIGMVYKRMHWTQQCKVQTVILSLDLEELTSNRYSTFSISLKRASLSAAVLLYTSFNSFLDPVLFLKSGLQSVYSNFCQQSKLLFEKTAKSQCLYNMVADYTFSVQSLFVFSKHNISWMKTKINHSTSSNFFFFFDSQQHSQCCHWKED